MRFSSTTADCVAVIRSPSARFFSSAPASRLCRPLVSDGFGPQHVNVADQRRDPDSLLAFMTLLIRRYRDSPELGWAKFRVLEQPHVSVLAHVCTWDDGSLVAMHNLGPDDTEVDLGSIYAEADHPVEVFADRRYEPVGKLDSLRLGGYGYRWIRLCRSWSPEPVQAPPPLG